MGWQQQDGQQSGKRSKNRTADVNFTHHFLAMLLWDRCPGSRAEPTNPAVFFKVASTVPFTRDLGLWQSCLDSDWREPVRVMNMGRGVWDRSTGRQENEGVLNTSLLVTCSFQRGRAMQGGDGTDSGLQDEPRLLPAGASRCPEMVLLLLAALLSPCRPWRTG